MASRIEAAVQLMEHLCTHDWHGYDQVRRWGDGEGWCDVWIDGARYQIAQGDRDCSSAIISALQAAGIDCGGATYTGNMVNGLTSSGNFEWRGMDYTAQRGDIYLNVANHTAMCTSPAPDMLAEFSINERGGITGGAVGDQTGRESHVRGYYDYPWDGILRYIGGDRPSAQVGKPVQLWTPNNTDAQRWAVEWTDTGAYAFRLKNKACGLYLDVVGGGTGSGTGVWAYTGNGTDAQLWSLVQAGKGYFPDYNRPIEVVPALNPALRLDCVGGGQAQGTQIQVHAANGTGAQQWQVLDKGNREWVLVNIASSLALDVVGGGR